MHEHEVGLLGEDEDVWYRYHDNTPRTEIYPSLSPEHAMRFGHNYRVDTVSNRHGSRTVD